MSSVVVLGHGTIEMTLLVVPVWVVLVRVVPVLVVMATETASVPGIQELGGGIRELGCGIEHTVVCTVPSPRPGTSAVTVEIRTGTPGM
jgi:hypothetical protein